MASLLDFAKEQSGEKIKKKEYLDKQSFSSFAEQNAAKEKSTTVYVGNLSFYSSETQVYALFSLAGNVNRVVMGLHRVNRTPCGFCFVIFNNRKAMLNAQKLLNGCILDGQVIKVEVDPGFREGRQYGRARSGGQVRDELRATFDANRGGYGAMVESQMEAAKAELLTPLNHVPGALMPPPRVLPPPNQNNFHDGNFRGRGRRGRGGRFHPYGQRGGYRDFRDRDRNNRRRNGSHHSGYTDNRKEARDDPNPRWRRNDSDEDEDQE